MTSTLEHCPICAHDLHTLPPPNRCPECGFAYDERTRVWRSAETWGRLALMYAAIGLLVGSGIAVVQRIGLGQALNPMLPVLCALGAPVLGLLFRRILGGRISGRFVALSDAGLLVRTRGTPRLVPWEDFQQLTVQRGVLKIRRRESPVLIPLDDIFSNAAEADEFSAAVKAAARTARRPSAH